MQSVREIRLELEDRAPLHSRYGQAREAAFRVKLLAELHHHWDHARFGRIKEIAKSLEDALGEFQDDDELPAWFAANQNVFPFSLPAVKKKTAALVRRKRREGYARIKRWLVSSGWLAGRNEAGRQIRALQNILGQIQWPTDTAARSNLTRHMVQFLAKLQGDIERGSYSPSEKFYGLREYSSRVHQLRIDIRRVSQYASFAKGQFRIVRETSVGAAAVPEFFYLKKTAIASSRYSRLPYAANKTGLPIAESAFLAINQFVAELETAKAFPLSIERIRSLVGKASKGRWRVAALVRTNPAMTKGPYRTTDEIALDIIEKVRRSKIFSKIAKAMR